MFLILLIVFIAGFSVAAFMYRPVEYLIELHITMFIVVMACISIGLFMQQLTEAFL